MLSFLVSLTLPFVCVRLHSSNYFIFESEAKVISGGSDLFVLDNLFFLFRCEAEDLRPSQLTLVVGCEFPLFFSSSLIREKPLARYEVGMDRIN